MCTRTGFRWIRGGWLRRTDGFGADFGATSVAAAFIAGIAVGVRLAQIPFAEPEIGRRRTETGSGVGSRSRRRSHHEAHRLNALLTAAA